MERIQQDTGSADMGAILMSPVDKPQHDDAQADDGFTLVHLSLIT